MSANGSRMGVSPWFITQKAVSPEGTASLAGRYAALSRHALNSLLTQRDALGYYSARLRHLRFD
jgi:hypothetical protein